MLPQCPISNFAIVFEVEIKGKWHRHKHCFNLKNGGIFGEANGGHWLAYNQQRKKCVSVSDQGTISWDSFIIPNLKKLRMKIKVNKAIVALNSLSSHPLIWLVIMASIPRSIIPPSPFIRQPKC